jgi:LPXTG-motif cell wall-anchored protein
MDFVNSWAFMGIMAALLVGLIVLLVIVRKKQAED